MTLTWIFGVFLLAGVSTGQDGMCGMSKPDPSKTCISIRLPWKADPIHFCTEKENLRYEKRCVGNQRCPQMEWSNHTLYIATPWDCCPIASKPSHCENTFCPSKPFNRTCVTLPNRHSNGCCPMYFCEDSQTEPNCNLKSLEYGCHTPPMGKKNCVGFVDHYGCCTKYQCEGEGKPGTCPALLLSTYLTQSAVPTHRVYSIATQSKLMPTRKVIFANASGTFHYSEPPKPTPARIEVLHCIGDSNCPGDMKCCSSASGLSSAYQFYRNGARVVYYPGITTESDSPGDSNRVFYDSKAVRGFCSHPEKSVEQSAQGTIALAAPKPMN